jgi:hypothetical protein
MTLLRQVDELRDRALWCAAHGQEQWQSQPAWAPQYSGEALQCCRISSINSLEHQGRSPTGPLGELVAHIYKLRVKGWAWKLT